jgi:hypothetical protein
LNFLAGSFPDTGGYLVIVAAFGILGVALFEQFNLKKISSAPKT